MSKFLLREEQGKPFLEAMGGWRLGRAQSLFAILARTLLSSHVFPIPPPYHNPLLKYSRTVSCLKAPWSLQREELIQIQTNKFHLKWDGIPSQMGSCAGELCTAWSLLIPVNCITTIFACPWNFKLFNTFNQNCMKWQSQMITCVRLRWASGGNEDCEHNLESHIPSHAHVFSSNLAQT